MENTSATSSAAPPRLRRTLTLWDLILYGIIVIQPTAPMPAYGVFSNAGQGHVVTVDSDRHGRDGFHCDELWPHGAGVSQCGFGLHLCGARTASSLGYVTGWSMTMDYILNPLICTIWCAKAMADLLGRDALSTSISRSAMAGNFCITVHAV